MEEPQTQGPGDLTQLVKDQGPALLKSLASHLETLQSNYSGTRAACNRKDQTIQQLEAQFKELTDRLQATSSKLVEANRAVTTTRDEASEQVQQLKQQLSTALASKQRAAKLLEDRNAEAQSRLTELQSKAAELERRLASYDGAHSRRDAEIAQKMEGLKKDLVKEKTRRKKLEEDQKSMQEANDAIAKERDELKRALRKSREAYGLMQNSYRRAIRDNRCPKCNPLTQDDSRDGDGGAAPQEELPNTNTIQDVQGIEVEPGPSGDNVMRKGPTSSSIPATEPQQQRQQQEGRPPAAPAGGSIKALAPSNQRKRKVEVVRHTSDVLVTHAVDPSRQERLPYLNQSRPIKRHPAGPAWKQVVRENELQEELAFSQRPDDDGDFRLTSTGQQHHQQQQGNGQAGVTPGPQQQGGIRYQEVVRKKDERSKLAAFECQECQRFFFALESWGTVPVNELPTCGHVEVSRADLGEREKVTANDLRQEAGRHRFHNAPPATPTGFWDIAFTPPIQSNKQKNSTTAVAMS